MNRRNNEIPERVEFRFREHEREYSVLLFESAAKAGRNRSDHARELLKDALTANDQLQHSMQLIHEEMAQLRRQMLDLQAIMKGIQGVHDNLYQLRDNLANCIAKLLTEILKLNAEEAEQWLTEVFDSE